MPRTRRQSGGQTLPACKEFGQIRPGDATPACGDRVTVFGKPNFVEYNFSIPIGTYNTVDEIKKIPGNNGYTIYGGDGNVSFAFPTSKKLKMTINNGPNFSGAITYVYTKTCAEAMTKGSCGQTTWNPNWKPGVFAQSIKVEEVTENSCVGDSVDYNGRLPACKEFSQIRPGDATPACGERVSVFGKPNFVEYNFSIPLGTYNTVDEIKKIPGNNGYTIYGGDGNVSFKFPKDCTLKLTINNGPNFSGPITYVYTKTCPNAMPTGSCGQTTWNPAWKAGVYAQSIKLEKITANQCVGDSVDYNSRLPACKEFSQIRPGDATPACGNRVTVFGKPNFGEYNFSIPVGTYNTVDEIKKIPGNNGYTIYGGDGNVSFKFPKDCMMKMTINNGPNFSGPITYVYTKTCPNAMPTGSCGQTKWNPAWKAGVYAQSIKVEMIGQAGGRRRRTQRHKRSKRRRGSRRH